MSSIKTVKIFFATLLVVSAMAAVGAGALEPNYWVNQPGLTIEEIVQRSQANALEFQALTARRESLANFGAYGIPTTAAPQPAIVTTQVVTPVVPAVDTTQPTYSVDAADTTVTIPEPVVEDSTDDEDAEKDRIRAERDAEREAEDAAKDAADAAEDAAKDAEDAAKDAED